MPLRKSRRSTTANCSSVGVRSPPELRFPTTSRLSDVFLGSTGIHPKPFQTPWNAFLSQNQLSPQTSWPLVTLSYSPPPTRPHQRRKFLGIWEDSVRPGMGEFWKTRLANVGETKCWLHVTGQEGAEMSQGNASLEFQLDNSCNETKQFEQPIEKYHWIFRRWAGCRFGGERTLLVLRVTLTNFSWPS